MEEKYLNRDLSWLAFNERVLELAISKKTPLLERLRYLSIFESNLDEFFMKRVGFLQRLAQSGYSPTYPDGRPASEILEKARKEVIRQVERMEDCYTSDIIPCLAENRIELLSFDSIKKNEKSFCQEYFKSRIFPVLTPLAVDPSHPFPFLSNLSLSLGVKLHQPRSKESLFARIKIPDLFPQWVRINEGDHENYRFVRLLDVVEHNLSEFFPKMIIENVSSFRVTRNANVGYEEEEAEDKMDMVEEELRQRRLGHVVRLELGNRTDPWISELLAEELDIKADDIYQKKGELSYLTLKQIANLGIPSLSFDNWTPAAPKALSDESSDIFKAIRDSDILVHHPYESFNASVERLIRAAVEDPKVLAIKMTLYRTDENSPFIPLLIRAAEEGKQIVCVVELKARFDEARNIYWSEMLEKAGVHVVYGVVGLKTHTKNILIVRNESEGFRFYAHIGTGNYNMITAKLYTDYGLLTCDTALVSELLEVFNYLTGLSLKANYKQFLVAPINMREKFLQLIQTEIENKKKGLPARIIAKMNSLEDKEICQALYHASEAGVSIQLIVRGFCCLVPGEKDLSENIEVRSLVGRFLEHARVYYFQNGKKEEGEGLYYIASADWMPRNLNNRMETAAPINSKKLQERIWNDLKIQLQDNKQSWILGSDGKYRMPKNFGKETLLDAQQTLMKSIKEPNP